MAVILKRNSSVHSICRYANLFVFSLPKNCNNFVKIIHHRSCCTLTFSLRWTLHISLSVFDTIRVEICKAEAVLIELPLLSELI